jgi:ABC-2 type transport system permease protein
MASLRWHIFVNGLRSKMGVFELGARALALLIYIAIGLGLGALIGLGAYAIASDEKWEYLPAVFWVVFILWQMLPVVLASFQEQFDLGILLRFPVSFRSYFLLYVVFGLADVSTIMGVLCCLGIWIGVTVARPELFAWTALSLGIFAAFNILVVRTVFAWIDRWLAQRKTREIVGAIFMVLLLSLQLLNPALRTGRHPMHSTHQTRIEHLEKMRAEYGPWLRTADQIQEWLPPGLAARALVQAGSEQSAPALVSLAVFGLWALAAAGVLARRLRAEYRGENLGAAPERSTAAPSRAHPARHEARRWLGGTGTITAVVEKELRSLSRTLPLLWALGVPVLMVLVVASVFRNSAPGLGNTFQLAFPLYVAYALLGFTQLFYNNLGAEGEGIQLLFLSPTPIRTVFLAKNLFHSMLFGLDALLAGVLASLRLGWPTVAVTTATIAWLLFALPCSLAVGNIFSLTMPFRINPGRISRQRGSQANAISSLLVQLVLVAVGAAVFGSCWLIGNLWLAVPIFLALAGVAIIAWRRVLRNVDAIANRRRDSLLAALMKTE